MQQPTKSAKKAATPPVTPNSAVPRAPQRAHGRQRYDLLVDTTDRLLEEHAAGDISLYDIAKAAKVPAASVYHFFPSMAAAVIAVAQRYLKIFEALISSPLEHDAIGHWRDVYRIKSSQTRIFFNSHAVARKIFLGSEYSWQVRVTDVQSNASYGRIFANLYYRHFEVPDPDFLSEKIEIGIGMSDSIWSLSCVRHGIVTDEYMVESQRAFNAYLNCYIAEIVPKRNRPLDIP